MVTQKEEKERAKTRREKIGCYFLDMSKLTFAGWVVGGISPFVNGQNEVSFFYNTVWSDYDSYICSYWEQNFKIITHYERTYNNIWIGLTFRDMFLRMAPHEVGQEMVGRSRQVTAICQTAERAKAPIYGGFSYSMLLLTCSMLSPMAMVPVMHPSIFAFCCFFIGFLLPILSTSKTALS